jgi:IclR family KDG regulon transcriptional repressor
MSKPKSDYSIQTVTNALRVLEVFREETEIGVSDLSRRLGLHKNNVFRLLATLEEGGYIEQSESSELYRLGSQCLELGRAFAHGNDLLKCARPVLQQLSESLNESSHIAVLRNFEVVHIGGESSRQLVQTSSRVGQRLPAHCTALGKVLLGCSDAPVRERYDREIVSRSGLAPATESTITDPQKLVEQLTSVAIQGSAIDLEECEVGLCCAAAPVHDSNGRLLAAISVSGPCFRFSHDVLMRDALPAVVTAAHRLSQRLDCAI